MAVALAVATTGPVLAQDPAPRPDPARPVATVNGVAITAAELEAAVKTASPVAVVLPQSQRRTRQMEALVQLIDQVLMRQFLARSTPPVSPDEVAKRLAEMEAGLSAQRKSLKEFCQDTNQTVEQFRSGIADHLRWAAYARQQITDEAVAAYYQANKDFYDEVTVRASHIVKRLPPGSTEADRAKAREVLIKTRAELMKVPADDVTERTRKFAEMARKYSDDPRANLGGDLGHFPRKWAFDEAFSKAAFALKVGEISDVVQSESGYHLILATERKPGKESDFSKIKEIVREDCAAELREQVLAREREAVKNKVEVNLP
jgi:parvulin-like peptidyl-prolyl isomerase